MLLKWQCYLVQQYRRHGKYFVIFGLCLTINFLGHMIICGTNLSDGSLTHRNVHHNIYASLRSSASPKERHAFLVITILTGPVNFDRRKAIRETWLSSLPKDVQYYFMIGTKELPSEDRAALEYEQHQYKDLILLTNFKDSYYSLTSKVVSTFQWLDEHVDFQYVFKADDDTFARIDMISGELMKRLVAERFYWGFFDGRARVKKTGQWAEKNWILCDTYLPHARGGGYVLSRDLVQYISVNAEMLKQFNSEDISVGAWLGPLDIERKHDPRFDTEYRSRGCNNAYIVTHKQEGGWGPGGPPQVAQQSKRLQQTQAQVDEVVDIMRVNVDKVLERDSKLSELDNRADELQAGASQFEASAGKLKRKYWWKNCKMWIILSAVIIVIIIIIVVWVVTSQQNK